MRKKIFLIPSKRKKKIDSQRRKLPAFSKRRRLRRR